VIIISLEPLTGFEEEEQIEYLSASMVPCVSGDEPSGLVTNVSEAESHSVSQ
jgi:hypothetical protein